MTQRELCDAVGGFPHSYLGRVERGEQLPSESFVRRLDTFFEVDGMLVEFLGMAESALIPDYSRKVLGKEPEAERIQVFNSSLVPALLQTKDYTWELFRRSRTGETAERIAELVNVRMRRKRIFEAKEPPYYWAIMDEAALRRVVGSTRIMAAQLSHLAQMASKPRITVQILPFGAGAYPMPGGSLTLHTLRKGGTIGGVESFDSGQPVESSKRLAELGDYFDLTCSLALSGDESLDLLRQYLGEYENDDDS